MEKIKSWERVTQVGKNIRKNWKKLGDLYNLSIKLNGIPALSGFDFESNFNLEYKTLISQEMLKRGFLASNKLYVCTEHDESIIEKYMENLEDIFKIIRKCEDEKINIFNILEGPVCHEGFKRLN